MTERTKAWRRHREVVANNRHENRKDFYSAAAWFQGEKKWKMMGTRKQKLHRAQQLGFDYPIKTTSQLLDEQ